MQVLLILKVHLKSGTFYFLLKYGCHCVTSTFTKQVNIYLFICNFTSTTDGLLIEQQNKIAKQEF